MPTAHKLPSGSWRCQYYAGKKPDGKYIVKSVTASTKKEAERLAAIQSMQAEQDARAPQKFIDAANAYVENRRGVLSPATITTYQRIIRSSFEPLSLLTVDELTDDRIQSFVSDFALSHSPKTTSSVFGLLSSIIASVFPDRRLHVRLPQRRPPELQIPTQETVRLMIDRADGPLRSAIILASAMGLRRAEICALTWADVSDSTLRVRRALVKTADKDWISKAPKTASGTRSLTIPPAAAPVFKRPADAKDGDQIIPLTPDALTRRFERLCASLDISYHFHALRHYYASVLLALNVPDKYAMQRMGHATPNMLKQVYQHIMANQQDEIDDQINQFFK